MSIFNKNRQMINWVMLGLCILMIASSLLEVFDTVSNAKRHSVINQEKYSLLFEMESSRILSTYEMLVDNVVVGEAEPPMIYGVSFHFLSEDALDISDVETRYSVPRDSKLMQNMLFDTKSLWSLEHASNDKGLSLNMIKRVNLSADRLFVEVTFELSKFPPVLPYQMDTILLLIDQHKRTLLRENATKSFSPVQLNIGSSTINQKEISTVNLEPEVLLGFEFVRFGEDALTTYQLVEIPLPQLRSRVLILLDSTKATSAINDAIIDVGSSLALSVIFMFISSLVLRYWNYAEKTMYIDALTGLNNRKHLEIFTSKLVKQINCEHHCKYAVLALDIDHFKTVNDNYGHDVGDSVLKQLAIVMKTNTRDKDVCYRLGGEEFVVFASCQSDEQAKALAERLRFSIEQDSELNRLVPGGVTTSIGVAWFQAGTTVKKAMKEADEHLYVAKQRGRNLVQFSFS